MDDNFSLPDHEIRYEVKPASDVETKRESAPKAIARRSPVAIALGLLIVALLGYATYRIMWPREQDRKPPGRGFIGGAQPVGVATVARGDIKIVRNELGAVTPIANVIVKTQLNGYLTEVAFKEGQMVQKGDFLAQIDPRPYQVLKEQYEGQLRHDQGFLDQARADLKRYNTLMKQDSIARQQAENQVWVVKQYEGSVKSDQALVDNQTLNLTYAHIIAPISGRVGLRQVDAGNYVTTGDPNGVVLITQIDPISVIFSVPEDYLPEITAGLKARGVLQATALDRANANTLGVGRLSTLDNTIDTTTGMVKARAEFENKDEKLYPNQFVNIRLLVDVEKNVITMPAAAVQTGASGSFVYVVKEGAKVAVQPVTIGVADGGVVEVKSGVGEGDQVVIDGADRLRDGAEIKIADDKPASEAAAPPRRSRRDGDGAASDKRDWDPEKARERRARKRPDAE
jgi:membrane fusion protein, multidrug efflux system